MAFSIFTKRDNKEIVRNQKTSVLTELRGPHDFITIRKRFLHINQQRLNRTQDSLRQRQKDFIDLLPILFHMNHPLFPGYLSKATPCGISNYQPSQSTMHAARRFVKISRFNIQPLPRYDIYSIFIMGSVGTVAHSEKSDLDIWLCHSPNLNVPEILELRKKATKIEEWAKEIALEIHFFLMDATKFKNGDCIDISSESSGTAQHHLLLEEFYRTGLLVAGRYPAWWLIPPEVEKDYDYFLNAFIAENFISESDVIDFGGMAHVPAEEFVGAGLWQLYKGIDSPYKSVLKILLMEIYAKEYPAIDLLCMRYKKSVYAGITNLDKLDPYIMLINKLEEYLKKRNELLRLDFVRRCFYIKINIALSSEESLKIVEWKCKLMQILVQINWQWEDEQIKFIDAHDNWKIDQVLKERKILVEELTNSYLFLSNFGREHAQILNISQNDFNILGRKLYAALERKAEKIDIVYLGITKDLFETHITIQQSLENDEKEYWLLFNNPPNKNLGQAIKQTPSVLTLLAWGYFNKIISPHTMIAVKTRNSALNIQEVNAILRSFKKFDPCGKILPPDIENFNKPVQLVNALLFINIGIDPMARYNRAGTDFISNTNVLSYGNLSINLALTLDLLLFTSWQEVLNFSYKEKHALVDSLCQYLYWNLSNEANRDSPLSFYSFSSSHAISLVMRIEKLFKDVYNFFVEQSTNKVLRYLFICGDIYYILYLEDKLFRYTYKESLADLKRFLNEPNQHFVYLSIDEYTLQNTPLPVIYKINKINTVQFFYQISGKIVDIYVLDERGSLFCQRASFYNDEVLLDHFDEFFDSVLGEISIHAQIQSSRRPRIGIMFYEIKNESGNFVIFSRSCMRLYHKKHYFSVRVRSNSDENNTNFTFYCEDIKFESCQYGNGLFNEVANYILAQRRNGLRYPIYVTSVDPPPALLKSRTHEEIQMVDFLNYKKRIEDKLNEKLNLELE